MKTGFFKRRARLIFLLIMIALTSLGVRLLVGYDFHESALLYVGMPFLIAVALILLRPAREFGWKRMYLVRMMDAFIIMLGSSVVLFEGFVCVVMFVPIYLMIVLAVFMADAFSRRARARGRSTLGIQVLPLLIAVSAVEGVGPGLSLDRDEQVSASRIVRASVADLKRNLLRPIDLQKPRPWFLRLFPMPYAISAGSLNSADVHEIHFRYYRWFVTNVHEGRMLLEISAVEANRIRTTFIEDTSYIAGYLRLKGTEILLEAIDANTTRVTLRIDYERTLDPYWYFSPVSRYGVGKAAEFLITEVVAHDSI